MTCHFHHSSPGLQQDDPSNTVSFFSACGYYSTYVPSDEALHAKNSSSREHWLEHVLSLFCLAICEESEGGMVFAESFIQNLLLVPASRWTIDFIICRGICKMEL